MIVVTGGTGLVGSRLIFDLISSGKPVTALIRPETSKRKFKNAIQHYTKDVESIANKITWFEGDLGCIEDLMNLLNEGDQVYHCAAKVSFNPKEDQETIAINVEGTANLVNACLFKNVNKLCHVSSIGALGGKTNGKAIDEETPWSSSGKSAYSLSKYYSELEIWRGMAEGLNAVVVNPSVILGAGDWNNGSPRLFSMVANGMKFYTKGSTGYVDVADVVKAMILLMESDISGERFLLSAENISYKKLFTDIAQAIGVPPPSIYANKFITAMAYKAESIRSSITNTEPKLTKQTHKISHKNDKYMGSKILSILDFKYTPIAETIAFIGSCFTNKNHS